MFDTSILELIVIAIVFLLLLGPNEMATVMKKLGYFMRKVKDFITKVKDDIDVMAINDEYEELTKKIMQSAEDKSDDKEKRKK